MATTQRVWFNTRLNCWQKKKTKKKLHFAIVSATERCFHRWSSGHGAYSRPKFWLLPRVSRGCCVSNVVSVNVVSGGGGSGAPLSIHSLSGLSCLIDGWWINSSLSRADPDAFVHSRNRTTPPGNSICQLSSVSAERNKCSRRLRIVLTPGVRTGNKPPVMNAQGPGFVVIHSWKVDVRRGAGLSRSLS